MNCLSHNSNAVTVSLLNVKRGIINSSEVVLGLRLVSPEEHYFIPQMKHRHGNEH